MPSTTRRGLSHTDSQGEDFDASETSGAMVLLFDEAGYAERCDGYLLRHTPRSQPVKPTWIGYRLKSENVPARNPAWDHDNRNAERRSSHCRRADQHCRVHRSGVARADRSRALGAELVGLRTA